MTIHNNRFARAARAIATRLESEPEVRLTVRTEKADWALFRIAAYLNRYLGKYWMESTCGEPYVYIRQYRE